MLTALKKILIVLVAISLIGGIVFWMYYGDQGYIIITGDIPTSIEGVLLHNQVCLTIPCKLTTSPGTYSITLGKEGSYDIHKNIRVALWETQTININFLQKPALEKIGTIEKIKLKVPIPNNLPIHDLDGTILANKLLSSLNFSKNNGIYFTPSGTGALLLNQKNVQYIEQNKSILTPIAPSCLSVSWDREKAYCFDKDTKNKWTLLSYAPATNEIIIEGSFYNLVNPRIYPSERNIFIVDQNNIFLFNVSTHTKKKIEISLLIDNPIIWNKEGTQCLFQTKDGIFHLFDADKEVELPLPITQPLLSIKQFSFSEDGTLLYAIVQNEEKLSIIAIRLKNNKTTTILELRSPPANGLSIQQKNNILYVIIEDMLYRITGTALID